MNNTTDLKRHVAKSVRTETLLFLSSDLHLLAVREVQTLLLMGKVENIIEYFDTFPIAEIAD